MVSHVSFVLILAFALGLVWPIFDHHFAERYPWHEHMVVAGSEAEFSYLLEHHIHQYQLPHEHDIAADSSTPTSNTQDASGLVLVTEGGVGDSIPSLGSMLLAPIPSQGLLVTLVLLALPALILLGRPTAVPSPPPRLILFDTKNV